MGRLKARRMQARPQLNGGADDPIAGFGLPSISQSRYRLTVDLPALAHIWRRLRFTAPDGGWGRRGGVRCSHGLWWRNSGLRHPPRLPVRFVPLPVGPNLGPFPLDFFALPFGRAGPLDTAGQLVAFAGLGFPWCSGPQGTGENDEGDQASHDSVCGETGCEGSSFRAAAFAVRTSAAARLAFSARSRRCSGVRLAAAVRPPILPICLAFSTVFFICSPYRIDVYSP